MVRYNYHSIARLTAIFLAITGMPAWSQAPVSDQRKLASLGHAVEDGNLPRLIHLLDSGINVNAHYDGGINPGPVLLIAAQKGSVSMVKALLQHGADVNARSKWTQATAIQSAAGAGSAPVMRLLLDHGATVESQPGQGTYFSTAWKSPECMALLLSRGVRPTREDLDVALAMAVIDGRPTSVQFLLAHGANPNARNNFLKCTTGMTVRQVRDYRGPTVLQIAKSHLPRAQRHQTNVGAAFAKIVQLLQRAGAAN